MSIAEAIRAINQKVNPGLALEIAIDAVRPGSFRARLKTAKKTLKNLFSVNIPRDIIIGLLATCLWEKVISPEEPPRIIINYDSVISEHGSDRISSRDRPTKPKRRSRRTQTLTGTSRAPWKLWRVPRRSLLSVSPKECETQFHLLSFLGTRLIDRQSQSKTVAARTMPHHGGRYKDLVGVDLC